MHHELILIERKIEKMKRMIEDGKLDKEVLLSVLEDIEDIIVEITEEEDEE